MSLETITQEIQNRLQGAPLQDVTLKLDFGSDGCVHIDTTDGASCVTNEDKDADTTLICDMDMFKKIVKGEQDPTMAYMMGKLKIQGNMGLAMKLSSLLED